MLPIDEKINTIPVRPYISSHIWSAIVYPFACLIAFFGALGQMAYHRNLHFCEYYRNIRNLLVVTPEEEIQAVKAELELVKNEYKKECKELRETLAALQKRFEDAQEAKKSEGELVVEEEEEEETSKPLEEKNQPSMLQKIKSLRFLR